MKKYLLIVTLALMAIRVSAQSLNILNYSGKMYVTKIDVLSTPRYVSFEDHAVLSQDVSIPAMEVTKIIFDFENDVFKSNDTSCKIASKSIKKYSTEMGWNIVISFSLEGDTSLFELVWQQYDSPYFQEVTKTDENVMICRMHLSTKPAAIDADNVLLQLFGGFL